MSKNRFWFIEMKLILLKIYGLIMSKNRFSFIEIVYNFYTTEASEIAQAKLKGLDESAPKHNTVPLRPKPDINSFKNNQVKFAGGAITIPPDQMKCNIFKAKIEEELKKGFCTESFSLFASSDIKCSLISCFHFSLL